MPVSPDGYEHISDQEINFRKQSHVMSIVNAHNLSLIQQKNLVVSEREIATLHPKVKNFTEILLNNAEFLNKYRQKIADKLAHTNFLELSPNLINLLTQKFGQNYPISSVSLDISPLHVNQIKLIGSDDFTVNTAQENMELRSYTFLQLFNEFKLTDLTLDLSDLSLKDGKSPFQRLMDKHDSYAKIMQDLKMMFMDLGVTKQFIPIDSRFNYPTIANYIHTHNKSDLVFLLTRFNDFINDYSLFVDSVTFSLGYNQLDSHDLHKNIVQSLSSMITLTLFALEIEL